MKISVQQIDFDVSSEMRRMTAGHPAIGALACFVGLMRDRNDGAGVARMSLEHYPGMTEKSLATIVETARGRWAVQDCTVIHRVGEFHPTDQIVLVIVASEHRADAFAACQFIMDYLKTDAPFWKKEQTPAGDRWVEARESDDAARERWGQTS